MLFFQALFMLLAYDVLSALCRFQTIYSMVRGWKVDAQSRRTGHHRPGLHGGQLRLRLVPETGSLPAALLRHYIFAQEAWCPGADGPGRAEIALQGPCLG